MGRLTILIAVAAILAVPSTAAAAPLSELPFTALPDRGTAACLSPTGAPGGLSLLGPFSRRQVANDLLTATGDGARARDRVQLGRLYQCPAVAEGADGTSVVAGVAVNAEYEPELRAAVRDPGGPFGASVALTDRGTDPVAAVGPTGHAVVAWGQRVGKRRVAILAARRAPGGAFGAPETMVDWRMPGSDSPQVDLAAAVDAVGTVSLVWTRELPPDDFDEHAEAATAAPGGTFTVQRLASGISTVDAPVVSVAPDGWTLAAFKDASEDLPQVFERAPGAAFGAVDLPTTPGRERPTYRRNAALAVRDGGGAVIAWAFKRSDESRGVEALTRETAGAFGAIRIVAEPPRPPFYEGFDLSDDFLPQLDLFNSPPFEGDIPPLRAALGPGGRVALAWTAPSGRTPLRTETAHVATGRLDGTFDAPQPLGASLRTTHGIAPLFLADGRAAVAWTDNADGMRDGRLHVAVEGVPAAPPAGAPRLTLRAPRSQRLFASQSPRVIAGCDRSCDLRTVVIGPEGNRATHRSSTRRAGARPLDVGSLDNPRRLRSARVRVVVHATVPGGGTTAVRTVRVRVTRLLSPPLRRPRDVTARRDGDEIVVRWRTAKPARRQSFILIGHGPGMEEGQFAVGTYAVQDGAGRRRFRVRLRPAEPDRVRRMTVLVESYDSGEDGPLKTVRVR